MASLDTSNVISQYEVQSFSNLLENRHKNSAALTTVSIL